MRNSRSRRFPVLTISAAVFGALALVSCQNDVNHASSSVPDSSPDASSLAGDYSGSGTATDPYLISGAESFRKFRDDYNAGALAQGLYARLTEDINLSGSDWTPIGTYERPFEGVFDGAGKTIRGLNPVYTRTAVEDSSFNSYGAAGLFGYVKSSSLSALRFTDASLSFTVSGKSSVAYAGALAGYALDTSVKDVRASISVGAIASTQNESSYLLAGGLIGGYAATEGETPYFYSLTGLSATGDIALDMNDAGEEVRAALGGLIGQVAMGTYANILSLTNSAFSGNLEGNDWTGGILGYAGTYVSIGNCVASGDHLRSLSSSGAYAGGLMGFAYYDTAVLDSYASFGTIDAALSTSSYYKSYAGHINGYSAPSDYTLTETLGASVINSYGTGILSGDIKDDAHESALSLSEIYERCQFDGDIWNLDGDIPVLKDDPALNKEVTVTYKALDGVTEDVSLVVDAASYSADAVLKAMTDERTKAGYSWNGYAYDAAGEEPYVRYAAFTHDTVLYGRFVDLSSLLGSYSVTATYYENTFSSGIWTFTEDSFIWLLADGGVSYYDYRFDGEHVYIGEYAGLSALEEVLGGYANTVFSFADGALTAYDINDTDGVYTGVKRSETVLPADYRETGIAGDWYTSAGTLLHFLEDGNYYGHWKTSAGEDALATGGYSLTGSAVEIGYAYKLIAKTSAVYDENLDIVYNAQGIVLSREAPSAVYKTTDGLTSITVIGQTKYAVKDGKISVYDGDILEGGEVLIAGDTYTVSGSVLTLKEAATDYPFVKTWTGKIGANTVTLVLNADGTGTYGDTAFTWTMSGDVITGKASYFTLTMTYDEAADTLSVTYEDDDYNEFSGTLSPKIEAGGDTGETKSYLGTWSGKIGLNTVTVVLDADGTGTYGETAFAYTVSGTTISGTASDSSFSLTMTYDAAKDTLAVNWTDEYEGYSFEGTLTRVSA